MAILIFAFNRWEYHPLVRSAVLTSVFGYSLAGVAIFSDIGRYWNGYRLFLPWTVNFNSVLVEVALCIGAYVTVLWIELLPAVLEAYPGNARAVALRAKLEKWLPLIAAVGIILPTMHQSSLGTLMIIAGPKLLPLWQTHWLPFFFLVSAILMGYAVTVFESMLSSIAFKRPFETTVLSKLSMLIGWLAVVFLIVRLGDIILRGVPVFSFGLRSVSFLAESLLFLAPALLILNPGRSNNVRTLFIISLATLLAGSLYRFNSFLIGYNPGVQWHYFPATQELLITVGLIAIELLAYLFFIKKFPVLPKVEHA